MSAGLMAGPLLGEALPKGKVPAPAPGFGVAAAWEGGPPGVDEPGAGSERTADVPLWSVTSGGRDSESNFSLADLGT
jgi:hypothetical protein